MFYREIHALCTFWISACVWITLSRFLKYRLMNVILCTFRVVWHNVRHRDPEHSILLIGSVPWGLRVNVRTHFVLHPPFSFLGLLSKWQRLLALQLCPRLFSMTIPDSWPWQSWGNHCPVSSVQTPEPPFSQCHPHPVDQTTFSDTGEYNAGFLDENPSNHLLLPRHPLLGSVFLFLSILPLSGTSCLPAVHTRKFVTRLIADLSKEVVASRIWERKGACLCSPPGCFHSGLHVSDSERRLNGLE